MKQLTSTSTLPETLELGYTPEVAGPIARWYSRLVTSIRYPYPSASLDIINTSLPTPPVIYGRSETIKEIVDNTDKHDRTLAILGIPGVGKTCVASAVLYEPRIIERFGARRHWAELGGVTTLESFRHVILQSLACDAPIRSSRTSQTTEKYHSQSPVLQIASSATHEWKGYTPQEPAPPRLLILNDFDDIWNSDWREEAQDVLRKLPELTIVVTMRGTMRLPQDWWRLEINPLSPRAAKLLFFTIHLKSDSQLDLLLEKVAYLPRSIVWMAHVCQIKGVGPSELLKEWGRGNYRFLELQGGSFDDPDASIESWVRSTSMQLPPEAKRLVSILSMLPSGMLYGDLPKIDPHIRDAYKASQVLSKTSLVSIHHNTQVSIPPLLRPHSLRFNQLERSTLQDLYSHFFTVAEGGLRKPGGEEFPQAVERLVTQQPNLEAILQYALDEGYVGAIEPTLQYSAPHFAIRPRIDIIGKALEVAQCNPPDLLLTSRCLKRLGDLHIAAGSYVLGSSLLGRAARLFKRLGKGVAAAECEIGIAKAIEINDRPKAIIHLEHTHQEFIRLGSIPGQARCSQILGELYLSDGREVEGQSLISDSLAKFHELSDMHGVAECTLTLAQTHLNNNRLDDARSALAALDSLRRFGDRSGVAKGQELLASLLLREGRLEDARLEMKKALGEYEWLGHHLKAAFCMWRLGQFSDDEEAMELYERAIPIFKECRFTFAMAECRLDLGLRYMMIRRFDEALLHLEIANPQLQDNGTGWLANFCLAAIIVCLRQDPNQAAQADMEMKNNRAALLATARMRTQSPWKLSVLTAEGATDSGDGQILVMYFSRSLGPWNIVFVDDPPSKYGVRVEKVSKEGDSEE